MGILSSKQAAEMLGTSERRIQQLAEELGLPRLGRQFVITEKDIKRMAARKTQRGPKASKK
jgi:hypothetical protein